MPCRDSQQVLTRGDDIRILSTLLIVPNVAMAAAAAAALRFSICDTAAVRLRLLSY